MEVDQFSATLTIRRNQYLPNRINFYQLNSLIYMRIPLIGTNNHKQEKAVDILQLCNLSSNKSKQINSTK